MTIRAIQTTMQLGSVKTVIPEVYTQTQFNQEMLKTARRIFPVGKEFDFCILRKQLDDDGIYPEDSQRGHFYASGYLAKNGFMRIGEGGKSLTPTRQFSRDSLWKRIQ